MSFFGDVVKFEKFNLHDMAQKLKKDPLRAAVGALDPLSTGVWNKITGKNWEPLVDQFGGAYGGQPITIGDTGQGVYGRAQQAGIPTQAGSTMHDIAHAITALFAGGYGAHQLGLSQIPGLGGQTQATQPQPYQPPPMMTTLPPLQLGTGIDSSNDLQKRMQLAMMLRNAA